MFLCCACCPPVTRQKSCAVELSCCGICALHLDGSTAADAQEVKESRQVEQPYNTPMQPWQDASMKPQVEPTQIPGILPWLYILAFSMGMLLMTPSNSEAYLCIMPKQ